MRLIKVMLDYALGKYNEHEINHRYVFSVWQFYKVYNMCLAVTGFEDPNIKEKNKLISDFISSSKKEVNLSIYAKIYSHIKQDMEIINLAMQMIEQSREDSPILGDYDISPEIIGVSVYA